MSTWRKARIAETFSFFFQLGFLYRTRWISEGSSESSLISSASGSIYIPPTCTDTPQQHVSSTIEGKEYGRGWVDVAHQPARDGDGGAAPGAAASKREGAKTRKYRPICERIGSQFRPAVIERHGHCGDGMCSVIKLLSGNGERSAMEDDISFTAPSRTTFVAQHLVFAAVMADAVMLDDALASALHRLPRRRGARG